MNQTNTPTHLPAQSKGFLAAKRQTDGGREPLSSAIYDSPDEAERAAAGILLRQKHEHQFQIASVLCAVVAAIGMVTALQCLSKDIAIWAAVGFGTVCMMALYFLNLWHWWKESR